MENVKMMLRRNVPVAVAAAWLLGCAGQAPQPRVKYVDAGAQGAVAGTGLESQDIGAAALKAAQSIVNLSEIAKAATPPVILVTSVKNHSATPIDTDLYTTKLRGVLMAQGGGRVRFLARDQGKDVNVAEQQMRDTGEVRAGGEKRSAYTYNYILTAEVRGISQAQGARQSEYFLVAFKLIDIHDMLLWEDQYEVKKEGRDNSIYR
ncbi:MAG: hypothetical protein ABSA97_09830 [Verrucomicrobiia bacterium]